MSCHITCLVGLSLLGGTVATMLFSKNTNKARLFKNSLDSQQLRVYERVANERANIYTNGLILGFILALVFAYKSNGFEKKIRMCSFMLIALGTNYIFYKLHPKSEYLLSHLESSMQIEAWLENYKEKMFVYHLGTIVTAVAYLLVSYGMFK